MWTSVQRAIQGWGTIAKAEEYLANFIGLVGRYFDGLYRATVPVPGAA